MELITFPVHWEEMFCLTATHSEVLQNVHLFQGYCSGGTRNGGLLTLTEALWLELCGGGRCVPGPLAAHRGALSADPVQHVWPA